MEYKTLITDTKAPYVYWLLDKSNLDKPEEVVSLVNTTKIFNLVLVYCNNWDDDYSPWKSPPVFGSRAFGGKGQSTLEDIEKTVVKIGGTENFITGYSLSGLFAMWAFFESRSFKGFGCCSGSLWFPEIVSYVEQKAMAIERSNKYGYLSLGNKEEKTKNPIMRTVGDNTRKINNILNNINGFKNCLVWNEGGHFSEPMRRTASSVQWLMSQL